MNTHTSLFRLPVTRVLAAGFLAGSIAGGAALARRAGRVGRGLRGERRRRGAPAAGLRHVQRGLAGVPALRRGREHVGRRATSSTSPGSG